MTTASRVFPPAMKVMRRYLTPESLELLERMHDLGKKAKGALGKQMSLTVLTLENMMSIEKDLAIGLKEVLRQGFGDVDFYEEGILPFYAAHLHRDADMRGKILLSVAAIDTSPYVLNAVATDGSPSSFTTIRLETGSMFTLDPLSWHACMAEKAGMHMCTLLQAVADKEQLIKSGYLDKIESQQGNH